jgi:Domain of unknown function (DUF4381)
MNGTDAASLDRLHDIFVPPPVAWWPPAPGWYLLAALVIVLLILFLIRQVMLWHANAYRRAALAELNQLSEVSATAKGAGYKLREASEILKRTALAAGNREDVAGLSGKDWIDWLNAHGGGAVFRGEVAGILEERVYQTNVSDVSEDAVRDAMDTIRDWIGHHRVEPLEAQGN